MTTPDPRPSASPSRRAAMARDAGLRRISATTRWVGAGAVALSGGLALIASNAFPGHAAASTGSTKRASTGSSSTPPSSSSSAPSSSSPSSTPSSSSSSSGLQAPSQTPQAAPQQQPVAVSGGS